MQPHHDPDREFTLDEAREALPVVRTAVERLQAIQRRLREVKAELGEVGRRHLNNGGYAGVTRHRQLRSEQRSLAEEVQRSLTTIRDAGAELKSITDGLLDFPTTIEGVPAYWCWRAGEADIEWWHPRSTGFAGRRRIEGR